MQFIGKKGIFRRVLNLLKLLHSIKIFIFTLHFFRGKLVERSWKRSDGSAATIDDISAFAIPIVAYKEEYAAWCESHKSLLLGENGNGNGARTFAPGTQPQEVASPPTPMTNGDVPAADPVVLGGGGVQDVYMDVAEAEEAVELVVTDEVDAGGDASGAADVVVDDDEETADK